MLILSIPKYFHKLLKYGGLAAVALLCKACGVVVVTVNMAIVLIVAVFGTKGSGANGACEVVDVVFAIQGCHVRTPQCTPTAVT